MGHMARMARGQAGARRGGPQRGGAGLRAQLGHHLMMLVQLDANKDQQISKEEMTALFDKIDANSDGQITMEEGKAFHETQRAEMTKKMKEAFSPDNIFKKLDKNGDGKLSKEDEIKFWDRLSRADPDKDGSVTKEEFDAGAKKLQEAMKQRRGNRRGGPQKEEPKKEEAKAESASIELPVPMPEEAPQEVTPVVTEVTEPANVEAVEAAIPTDTSAETQVD